MKKLLVKRKKKNIINLYKFLTKFLTTSYKNRDIRLLNNVLDKFNPSNRMLLFRLSSYFLNNFKIIKIISDYMNDLYRLNYFDKEEIVLTFAYLYDVQQMTNQDLTFLKKTVNIEFDYKPRIMKLFKDYYQITRGIYLNERELNFLYKMFKMGYIDIETIFKLHELYGSSRTKQFDKYKLKELQEVSSVSITDKSDLNYDELKRAAEILDIKRKRSQKLEEHILYIENQKHIRKECSNCPLKDKPLVAYDTILEDFGEVDVIFIGLNPGNEEAKNKNPFVGKSGRPLREFFYEKVLTKNPNITWLITNIILCNTADRSQIPNVQDVFDRCYMFMYENILCKFPAKLYVPVGGDSLKMFSNYIKEGITKTSGKLYRFNDGKLNIFPIIHPSFSLRRTGSLQLFESEFEKLANVVLSMFDYKKDKTQRKEIIRLDDTNKDIEKPETKNETIKTVTKEFIKENKLLLVDVKALYDNTVLLMIYTNENGEKFYYIERNPKFTVGIKNAKALDCLPIDKVDTFVEIPLTHKNQLSSILRGKMRDVRLR